MTCSHGRCKKAAERGAPLCAKHLTAELDRLFSLIVRRRWPFCVAKLPGICVSSPTQCSHLVGRARYNTRWDLDNAVGHCAPCHAYLTDRPELHEAWNRKWVGDMLWEDLLDKAYGPRDADGRRLYPARPDKAALLAELTAEWEKLGGAA